MGMLITQDRTSNARPRTGERSQRRYRRRLEPVAAILIQAAPCSLAEIAPKL